MSEQEQASTFTTERKLAWLSNAPWAPTGYGNQTGLFVPRIKALGYDPMVIASWGLDGGILNFGGINVYPKGILPYAEDVGPAHAANYGARYLITLLDAWVFNNPAFWSGLQANNIFWIPWFPVDCEPLPDGVRVAVERAYRRLVYSKHGEQMVREAGLDCTYIPHGIDTKSLQPKDKAESRKILRENARTDLPDDAFVVGMVAANKGSMPSRKAFVPQILAFAEFKKRHKDAILYLHTTTGEGGEFAGVDLPDIISAAGLSIGYDVIFADRYCLFMGYPAALMANVYSAMDVHMLVSMGEGFGIPLVEAQSCGVPVITGDWTACSELMFSGSLIPKREADQFRNPVGAWQYVPRVGAIVDALEEAYSKRGDKSRAEKARAGALAYDVDKVTQEHWKPFLAGIFEDLESAEREIAATRPHVHTWAKLGLWNADGTMSVPCTDPTCTDELVVDKQNNQTVKAGGFNFEPNGVKLYIQDVPGSATWKIILREIERDYRLDGLNIATGDLILDVGAHVGIVSCYLAKRYPEAKITAFEPVPELFELLQRNLKANGIENVEAVNAAVTADGREVSMAVAGLSDNSGGSTLMRGTLDATRLSPSVKIELRPDERIKLLKIDCEGAEYEILTDDLLRKVSILRGEFHNRPDASARALLKHVKKIVPDVKVSIQG